MALTLTYALSLSLDLDPDLDLDLDRDFNLGLNLVPNIDLHLAPHAVTMSPVVATKRSGRRAGHPTSWGPSAWGWRFR